MQSEAIGDPFWADFSIVSVRLHTIFSKKTYIY